jgi:hypothetical protein
VVDPADAELQKNFSTKPSALAAVDHSFREAIGSGCGRPLFPRSHRLWARLTLVLSPHTTPDEAEHKIFDFIRSQRWYNSANISCTPLIPTHFFLRCKTTSIVAAS